MTRLGTDTVSFYVTLLPKLNHMTSNDESSDVISDGQESWSVSELIVTSFFIFIGE